MSEGLPKIVGQFESDGPRGTQEFERATDDAIRRESGRTDELLKRIEELETQVAALQAFHP